MDAGQRALLPAHQRDVGRARGHALERPNPDAVRAVSNPGAATEYDSYLYVRFARRLTRSPRQPQARYLGSVMFSITGPLLAVLLSAVTAQVLLIVEPSTRANPHYGCESIS